MGVRSMAELRDLIQRKLNPDQPSDPGGEEIQRFNSMDGGAAPASSDNTPKGGQFATGGGRVGAKGKTRNPPRRRAAKKAAPPSPNLSFDGKQGTGYGIKGGDPRVRTLQSALNRLGLTDSSGAALAVDGKYGPRTTSAVKKLQKALGLPVDGKVTPDLLKQASGLEQLPPKPPATPKSAAAPTRLHKMRRSTSPAEHVLDNGICMTCNSAALD